MISTRLDLCQIGRKYAGSRPQSLPDLFSAASPSILLHRENCLLIYRTIKFNPFDLYLFKDIRQ
jgi:hypothetical protein